MTPRPRRWVLAAGLTLSISPSALFARATPAEVASELPGARLQGAGSFRFLGLRVYDARLWVRERDVDEDWLVPLALELEYLRALPGPQIAERSLIEMRRQGEVTTTQADSWLAAMKRFFPDVTSGDRLTGVMQPRQGARFFHNGRICGELRDAEFARRFFGIWLAPQTSEPELRQALRGRA